MLAEGRLIGDRYEIIAGVGSGGMADVYKAEDRRLNRNVAIKVLKKEYSSDTNFVSKFRAEARSVAGLSHPNIVNVYDVGEEDGLYYIVMELVEGITLKKFIERKGKLELKEAVGIAIQIAQGMEAAHDNHIIHRDIKPQNIIISREGKVKVTDFGIAKAATSNTITTGAVGSVHYISPEQARGGYSDEKSDIYSLGVTLYEMLSGRMPFAADNTVSVALLHIQEEATPLRELDPSIPVSVEKIVQKCMQKKPERRYLSASDLIRDLKRAIANPDGEYVQLAAGVSDSPTIHLSDEELTKIKNARFSSDNAAEPAGAPGAGAAVSPAKEGKVPVLEEEDGDEMDPKMEKFMMIGGIAAIVILAVVIIVLIVKGFHLFGGDKPNKLPDDNNPGIEDMVDPDDKDPEDDGKDDNMDDEQGEDADPTAEKLTVPKLTGKSLNDAIDTLTDNGFKSYRYEQKFSDTFETGIVMSQTPEEGTEIEPTEEIVLIVSNGEEILTVPDVYNRIQEEAETILTDEGLKVKHEFEYSNDLEAGRVISTTPERGMEIRKGGEVTIVISRGSEKVMVKTPSLLGKTEEKAMKLLEDAGLYGNVTYAHSDKVAEGLVIAQDTSVDVSVEQGSTIGFSVSLGPEQPLYSYIGSVTIDSPFDSEEDSAHIVIKMDQTGHEGIVIAEGTFTAADFPMTLTDIEGFSTDSAIVYMVVDGVLHTDVDYAQFIQVEN